MAVTMSLALEPPAAAAASCVARGKLAACPATVQQQLLSDHPIAHELAHVAAALTLSPLKASSPAGIGVEATIQAVCESLLKQLDVLLIAQDGHNASIMAGSLMQRLRQALDTWREDAESNADAHIASLAAQTALKVLLKADLPGRLLASLAALDFESKKDAMRLFESILDLCALLGTEERVADYARANPHILQQLLDYCRVPEVSLQSNIMLRACSKSSGVVKVLLECNALLELLKLAQHDSFDISCEAFASLRALLLEQPEVCNEYIVENFATFFDSYHALLKDADQYVTLRQALRLLGEMLLDRRYKHTMIKYINQASFLQIHMKLLRHSSTSIQVDAFHIFKVFVGCPNKELCVHEILYRNCQKLIRLLGTIMDSRDDDETFVADVDLVASTLEALLPPPCRCPAA